MLSHLTKYTSSSSFCACFRGDFFLYYSLISRRFFLDGLLRPCSDFVLKPSLASAHNSLAVPLCGCARNLCRLASRALSPACRLGCCSEARRMQRGGGHSHEVLLAAWKEMTYTSQELVTYAIKTTSRAWSLQFFFAKYTMHHAQFLLADHGVFWWRWVKIVPGLIPAPPEVESEAI